KTDRQIGGQRPRNSCKIRPLMMSRVASGFALVLSGAVLLGWQLDLPILKAVLPGRVAMNPLTAVTFVLAGSGVWLETESFGGREMRFAARAAAGVVLIVGLVTLLGYVLGENLGLDQLMFRQRLGGNRIAPNTGLCFMLLGAALFTLDWESRKRF